MWMCGCGCMESERVAAAYEAEAAEAAGHAYPEEEVSGVHCCDIV